MKTTKRPVLATLTITITIPSGLSDYEADKMIDAYEELGLAEKVRQFVHLHVSSRLALETARVTSEEG